MNPFKNGITIYSLSNTSDEEKTKNKFHYKRYLSEYILNVITRNLYLTFSVKIKVNKLYVIYFK